MIMCLYITIGRKDPEGLFKTPPQTGHIARLEFKKRIEKDSEAKEAYERHLREEKDRREAIRQVFLFVVNLFLIYIFRHRKIIHN